MPKRWASVDGLERRYGLVIRFRPTKNARRIVFRNRQTTDDFFLFADDLDDDLAVAGLVIEFGEHDLLPRT